MKGMPGMPPMMGMMMEKMDEGFNPMEMCKSMMETVKNTAQMAGYATPEVRALFEDWANQVEGEVLELIRQKGQASPTDIAKELKVSEDTALYFISKLVRDRKIKITGMEVL